TPLYPVVPILGVLMCVFLLMSLMSISATRNFFLVYMAAGIVVYLLFGLWNSKLGRGISTVPDQLAPMEAPHPGD
ncbi:MAG: amino acid permease C-terminal domain-containing protein, partial [Caulobacteraceae bacterium]